tara:strand:- start:238 stop:456 length:219 start_codon:yes stop_codon:yes gene_type:complete
MREITTKGKMVMDKKIIVKIEKSGNRYNAWDADGVKHTSSIGTSTRKKLIWLVWHWNEELVRLVESTGGKFL